MNSIRLVLALHNHQPVGNFDGVFAGACRDAYEPFLRLVGQYPQIPFVLHTSGSLLEWIEEHNPAYVDRLKSLVEAGQVEVMGGGFYEPILTMIPPRDRRGQIRRFSAYLRDLFGVEVRGMWVPERVWEQSLVGDIVESGIAYTVLDDSHFRFAGLQADQLWGYYLTEEDGRLLRIFPGSERLRYLVPFRDVGETIALLRAHATEDGDRVVVLADDGEKFGVWPGTHKHVYTDGWLKRFFDALAANSDWIRIETFSQVLDQVDPLGKIYLPDASYREMTEWVLSPASQKTYHCLSEELGKHAEAERVKPFLRGGFWRNFKVKYPESDQMYSRMLEVSGMTAELDNGRPDVQEAQTELYRAQCNCPYWHGAFGGLYLPHLREAVYRHLIAAEVAVERLLHNDPEWVSCRTEDFNLDGRPEVRLANSELTVYLDPAMGGHLYELDLKDARLNLLATLSRRPEAYHDQVVEAARSSASGEVASIHDTQAVKQPGLDKKLFYDPYPRRGLIDHFFAPDETLEALATCRSEPQGDFSTASYDFFAHRRDSRVSVTLTRQGTAYGRPVRVTKQVMLRGQQPVLEAQYQVTDVDASGQPLHFGVEVNLAGLPGGEPDRFFRTERDGDLGPLDGRIEVEPIDRLILVDQWRGLEVVVHARPAAAFWAFPIQTVSQSEGGFELVHQSTAVIPHWHIPRGPDPWEARLCLEFRPHK